MDLLAERPAPLRLYHWIGGIRDTLGPGLRAVVWVQGCSLRCPGCMVPETWSPRGGSLVDPEALAQELLLDPEIDGVTVSGGEPTEQAAAVFRLLAAVKRAGKNTWLYSGYTLEELVSREDPDVDALLTQVDVLVDGRYEIDQAGTFLLRGSANQRIIHLTDAIARGGPELGETSRVEILLDEQGRMVVVGVPPPGFLGKLKSALQARGLTVDHTNHWG